MKFIKSLTEFKKIPRSTNVFRIEDGKIETFIVVGTIKQSQGLILLSHNSLTEVLFLHENDFNRDTWSADYNKKEAGTLMIEQVNYPLPKGEVASEVKAPTNVGSSFRFLSLRSTDK